jgi:hypothetical protein
MMAPADSLRRLLNGPSLPIIPCYYGALAACLIATRPCHAPIPNMRMGAALEWVQHPS